MKKIIYIFISISALLNLTSCDLDTNPTNAVTDKLALENVENTDNVLNGTWAYLMDTYFTYRNPGWASLFRASDAMAIDVAVQPAKYGYLAHYSFTEMNNSQSSTTRAIWTLAYKSIDNMNHVLKVIDQLEGDEETKKRIKGQAYALRGYLYLNLVTYYGSAYTYAPDSLSVPIYTEPTNSDTKSAPRQTVKVVYTQAEEDLLSAYDLIGDYKRNAKHKIDKSVVAGVLARLYQLKGDKWALAQKFAAEAHQNYQWMSKNEYLNGFNDRTNSEWVWGHGQTPEQSTASYNFQYIDVSSSASGYYSFMADPYFQELFDNNDVRSELFEWDVTRYKGGLMYKKFRLKSDETGDIVLMRKAELVLIEAEAFAELDESSKAIEKLNELREARGADTPDLSGISKEELINEILIERRKELFGEGFGLYDIKRRKLGFVRKAVADEYIPNSLTIKKKGHTIFNFNDGTDFVPNSDNYNFIAPALETDNNENF